MPSELGLCCSRDPLVLRTSSGQRRLRVLTGSPDRGFPHQASPTAGPLGFATSDRTSEIEATCSRSPGHRHGSPYVPTIAGHGLHFDSGGSEELADLGGVLKDVQRHTADNHAVQHAVVSMGAREWPSRRVLGERVKRSAHPSAAVVDVTEEFGLGEHTVGKA